MKILIPVGGVGKRFKDEGFDLPKPLINVLGKPMIHRVINSLQVSDEDEIHIIYNNFLQNYNFEHIINSYFPKKDIKFHRLTHSTKGASETVLNCINELTDEQLNDRFLIVDCDTFYHENILDLYKENNFGNLIFYFLDEEEKPIFSYINIEEDGKVIQIKEKVKISNFANVGAYGFESGNILKKYCKKIIDSEGELYISKLYEKMIGDDVQVYSQKISKFNCVGTPIQLKVYCSQYQDKSEKLRFCFDLDNTLVTYPKKHGDYSTVEPIWRNINYLKFLKKLGHTIIIHTARRMRTHNGNVGSVVSDIGKVTIETLENYGIPYDELVFGKPYANFYIDDLSVNANESIDKFVGIYDTYDEPRYFNKVIFYDDKVEKVTNNEGEIFWYNNIPNQIIELFPKLICSDNKKITLEKINGVNFSYLYINKLLTIEHLQYLFETLDKIHDLPVKIEKNNIYSNYSRKIRSRYLNSINLYEKYKLDTIFEKIISKLDEYEKLDNGKESLIHGDPVFSNIILTDNGKIKLIDMRGKLGENLTLQGDIFYDFSKIYQSLIGYDFILKNLEIDNYYIEKFLDFFHSKFNQFELSRVKIITASMFFSLLPLHEEDDIKFKKYIKLINDLLKV